MGLLTLGSIQTIYIHKVAWKSVSSPTLRRELDTASPKGLKNTCGLAMFGPMAHPRPASCHMLSYLLVPTFQLKGSTTWMMYFFIDFSIVSRSFPQFPTASPIMISTWKKCSSPTWTSGTALHTAADTNNAAVAQVLLDAGIVH